MCECDDEMMERWVKENCFQEDPTHAVAQEQSAIQAREKKKEPNGTLTYVQYTNTRQDVIPNNIQKQRQTDSKVRYRTYIPMKEELTHTTFATQQRNNEVLTGCLQIVNEYEKSVKTWCFLFKEGQFSPTSVDAS